MTRFIEVHKGSKTFMVNIDTITHVSESEGNGEIFIQGMDSGFELVN